MRRQAFKPDAVNSQLCRLLLAGPPGLNSFVSSCELNQVNPFAWFRDVLARIPSYSIQKLDEPLPHNWTASHANAQ